MKDTFTEDEQIAFRQSDKQYEFLLDVCARSRGFSLERAMVELGLEAQAIGYGEYRRLRQVIGEPLEPERPAIPKWDGDTGELKFGSATVRTVAPRAFNIRKVLAAFERQGWPSRIVSPLPGGKNSRKLRETVESLNRDLKRIEIYSDGTGNGIGWRPR